MAWLYCADIHEAMRLTQCKISEGCCASCHDDEAAGYGMLEFEPGEFHRNTLGVRICCGTNRAVSVLPPRVRAQVVAQADKTKQNPPPKG